MLVKLVSERKIKKRFKENQLKPGKLRSGAMLRQLSLSHLLLSFLLADCRLGGTYLFVLPAWESRAVQHWDTSPVTAR